MAVTAGYDVGGAHLKVALAEGARIVAVRQIACPLWQGLDRLEAAFAEARPLTAHAGRHAATMTAELCEIFPDRRSGVATLVDLLAALLGPAVRVWMGPRGFGSAEEAQIDPMSVASTNFLATAEIVAERVGDALLVDMGSTTTDIIPVVSGRPCPRGLTDGERLATGELVYCGFTRTDVTAVAHKAPLQGHAHRLAAGSFATMADVRRILGELPENVDQHPTADGRGTSLEESLARLARCFGRDRVDATLEDWRTAAHSIADRQLLELSQAMAEVLAATPVPERAPVIAAGIGAGLVAPLAADLGRPCRPFADLIESDADCRVWATRCAPAVAVALLAAD
ncbi:MAG TPA: hydantoinase/oxoprolinase family protein [Hyphomicrobium sp.]|jgi:probable H4MPT-linked C1 transfer pathway protein